MNALNLFTKLYGKLQNYGMPFWVMSPFRRIVRCVANIVLPHYLSRQNNVYSISEKNLIVSMTSFPARIGEVWQVVKTLKAQSVLPDKIILWLSKEQFPSHDSIPDNLWNEVDGMFEIRMVEGDIRSHKKFYYVMQEYPDKAFVTCDDDIYYHRDMLKHLIDTSRQYPGCIIANTARKIAFLSDENTCSYNCWQTTEKSFDNENVVQIGVGGVLYPPHSLHELTLRQDLFINLTPLADDIWLNAMARLNGTPVVRSDFKWLPLPIKSDSPSLSSVNNGQNRNDEQIANVRNYLQKNDLPDLYAPHYTCVCVGVIKPILSFTSFPARIDNVWQVVECMFRQTLQPAKIILWLSKAQFPTTESVPQSLRDREGDLFEIRMVDGDIRSHKKYYYVSKEYPDSLIFLIDDDIYYDTDIIRRSVKAYMDYGEKCVICNYGYQIEYDKDVCKPYSEWHPIEGKRKVGKDLFFGSGGGTLFRPSDMYKDLTDIYLARKLTPLADDIWLNTMVMKAGLNKIMLTHGALLPIKMKENVTLSSVNNGESRNDEQINEVRKYYGDVFIHPFDT